jgi:phage repressor protein C with HTH and peptisase S24 domain
MSVDDSMDQRDPDAILRVVGQLVEAEDDGLRYLSEATLQWMADDLRRSMSSVERVRLAADADDFARRISARIAAQRIEARLPLEEARERPSTTTSTVSQARVNAAHAGCVPLLELSAAAGVGRALWDEPCESWLEVPAELADAQHVALSVSGDSMLPVLRPGDVIVVKLAAQPALDDLIVARVYDDGYVVKRVSALRGARMELSSLNPAYRPLTVRRGDSTLGVVVARFRRSS